jgi:cytochrome P450
MQFFGDGIFNVDGHAWSDARAPLRPQFHKQRISDLEIFERHIGTMISLLPRDGQTVDMLDWWHRFTLDSSTEFLFGKSVDSLLDPKAPSFLFER